MRNPFLTIDELRQKRDADLEGRVSDLTKTFGQVPLALANFQQVAQDRAAKASHAQLVEDRAADDQRMQQGDYQRRTDEAEQKASDASLKSFVAGEVDTPVSEVTPVVPEGPVPEGAAPQAPLDATSWRPQTDQEILAKAAEDPKLGRQDDNSVRSSLATEREASDKRALDKQYRQAQTDALNGKTEHAGSLLDYHNANLEEKKAEEAGRNSRAGASNALRGRGLDQAQNLNPDERNTVTKVQTQLSRIGELRKAVLQAGDTEFGWAPGLANVVRAAFHRPDLSVQERKQQTAILANKLVHDFAGSQQTKTELENAFAELGNINDPVAVQQMILQGLQILERDYKTQYGATKATADLSGKTKGLIPSEIPGFATKPPPGFGGKVKVQGPDGIFEDDAADAAQLIKAFPHKYKQVK